MRAALRAAFFRPQAGKLSATYISSNSITTDLTTYDFGTFDVGAGGLVVVVCAGRAGGTRSLSSVSIGGATGAVAITNAGTAPCGIGYRVAQGSINVSATFSAACQNMTGHVWVLRGMQSILPYDTDQVIGASADATSCAVTLDIPAGGVALFGHCHSNTNAVGWSSADEKADASVEATVRHAAAEKLSTTLILNHTETVSWTTNAVRGLAGASWR